MTKEEYQNTKAMRDGFRHTLKRLRHHPDHNLPPKIRQAQQDALVSQIQSLEREMATYKGKKT